MPYCGATAVAAGSSHDLYGARELEVVAARGRKSSVEADEGGVEHVKLGLAPLFSLSSPENGIW